MKSILSFLGVIFCALLFFSNSTNPPNARTGAPGDDGTCASGCHGGGSFQGTVDISGIPSTIQAGETYTVTLTTTATVGNPVTGGFQILALNSANQNVGDMIVTNGAETGTNSQGGREYMEHRGDKNFSGGQVSWTFDWQAPNGPNNEDITLWFVSVLANNNGGNNGDNVVTNTFMGTLTGAVDPLAISLDSKMDVSCFGGNDGTATVSTTGGTPPVTILWSNGQSGPTATGLPAGTYTATATDNAGMTAELDVTIGQPSQLSLEIVSETPITCVSPATITVDADGGTSGYTYLWSTGTPGPTEILNNATTVTVSVTDANNCVTSIDVTPILDIDAPIVSASGGLLTCLNQSVDLMVSANSPCGVYSYSWTDPNGNLISTDPSPTVTEPGTYTVVVTDICNGCTASAEATVAQDVQAPMISIQGGVDTISCNMPIVEIQVMDIPNATFSWITSNGIIEYGSDSPVVGVSQAGTYTLVVTNQNNGCIASADVEVFDIPEPLGQIDSVANARCFGEPNGYASLSATGGLMPYVFTWPDSMNMAIRNDLSAGNYMVIVSDSLGCVDTLMVSIGQPDALLTGIGSTPESAQGANDGSAWVSPSGGIPGYTVLWSTGETTDTISGLMPGMYQATVTDANGCTKVNSTTVQAFGCALTGTVSQTDILCFGDSTGSAIVTWMNENGAVSIDWSNGDTTAQITNLAAGEYIVALTDEGNCTFSDTITILQPSEIVVLIDSIKNTSGPGMNDGGIYISVSGGTSPYTFEWLLDNEEVGTEEDLEAVGAGNYLVVVRDLADCLLSVQGIEVQDPSSVQTPDWASELKVYPIPVQDILTIQLPAHLSFTIRLLDGQGMIVRQVKDQQTLATIQVEDLPQGAYWLLIQDDRGAFTVRPVIK